MRTAAVVLTAGRSRRMGWAKAWLELDGEPLLARVVRVALEAGADPVVVVAGCSGESRRYRAESPSHTVAGGRGDRRSAPGNQPGLVSRPQVEALLSGTVDVAVGAPDAHPIDSLRAGLARVPDGHAVLLWPVDSPFATVELLAAMAARLDAPDRVVVVETVNGWGHPVLFGPALAAELRSPVADAGADRVVRRDPARIHRVPWSDVRVAAELNTPEQAAALGVRLPASPLPLDLRWGRIPAP